MSVQQQQEKAARFGGWRELTAEPGLAATRGSGALKAISEPLLHQGQGIWAQGDSELVSQEGVVPSTPCPVLILSRLAYGGGCHSWVCFSDVVGSG